MSPQEENKHLAQQAALDQFGAGSSQVASIIAQYYKALIANEVPGELAGDLTSDFAAALWERAGLHGAED